MTEAARLQVASTRSRWTASPVFHAAPGCGFSPNDRFNLYQWFGGRDSGVKASFTVHDGTIWRQSTAMGVSVPKRRMRRENDFDWTLSVGVGTRQRLHRTLGEFGVFMGSDDQLAQHP
jgi:hypothetical protein